MGFFDIFFGKERDSPGIKNKVEWISLDTEHQINEIKERSFHRPQLIFKHSTTCGISRMVLRGFESSFPLPKEKMDLYYLDLLRYRGISNMIADIFGILHQSPQLLVVVDGEVVLHDSHGDINDLDFLGFAQS